MALKIHRRLLDQLRRHGEESYPYECCGVLTGVFTGGGKSVRAVARCGNARADSPHNRYRISPAELLRIQREARAEGRDIVGFYHSHPDRPAHWSSTDLAEAHWPGCSYVITSVEEGKAVLTNSFLLLGAEPDRRFEDEALAIEEEPEDEAAE